MKKEYVVELSEEEADELMDEHWVGELVRCKECKYNSGRCLGAYVQFIMCGKIGGIHKEDWFCAYGERREKDNGDK